MNVRFAGPSDAAPWEAMRRQLWPEGSAGHAEEIAAFFAGRLREPVAVLVAEDGGTLIGFAELSIRNVAEGCSSGHIAYLEGWYVAPRARRLGVGRALIAAAERWGTEQGCSEFASDARIDDESSAAAHAAVGFEEVERIRCFRKAL